MFPFFPSYISTKPSSMFFYSTIIFLFIFLQWFRFIINFLFFCFSFNILLKLRISICSKLILYWEGVSRTWIHIIRNSIHHLRILILRKDNWIWRRIHWNIWLKWNIWLDWNIWIYVYVYIRINICIYLRLI